MKTVIKSIRSSLCLFFFRLNELTSFSPFLYTIGPGGWLVQTAGVHGDRGSLLRADLETVRIKCKEVVSEEGSDSVGQRSTVPLESCGDSHVKCVSNAAANAVHELAREREPQEPVKLQFKRNTAFVGSQMALTHDLPRYC